MIIDNLKLKKKIDIILVYFGRDFFSFYGFVNLLVVYVLMVFYFDVQMLVMGKQIYFYVWWGNLMIDFFEDVLKEIEGVVGVKLVNFGFNVVFLVILFCVKVGDYIFIVDMVYGFIWYFVDMVLLVFNVEVEYYVLLLGVDIKNFFKDNIMVVFIEVLGFLMFEMQDILVIVIVVYQIDVIVLMDNIWVSLFYCQLIFFGVDFFIQVGIKYIVGYFDVMLGIIVVSECVWDRLDSVYGVMGSYVGLDDVYFGLCGFCIFFVCLEWYQKNIVEVFDWLKI